MRRGVIAVRVLYASACAMLEYSSMSVNRVYARVKIVYIAGI